MLRLAWTALTLWAPRAGHAAPAKTVRFKTADGVELAADFIPPSRGRKTFVLFHGLGAGRGEWEPLVLKLSGAGEGALAVDFRGHGQSGGPSFTAFRTVEDWNRLGADIDAAVSYLGAQGIPPGRIVLGGASIGANLALKSAARAPKIAAALLLSPGFDYHGIRIEESEARLGRPLLVAASREDAYAWRTAEAVAGLAGKKALFLEGAKGHGAQMFDEHFLDSILGWARGLERPSDPGRSKNRAAPMP